MLRVRSSLIGSVGLVLIAVAESDPDVRSGVAAFRQRLDELGWSQGRNLRIDYRWGGAGPPGLRALYPRTRNFVHAPALMI